MAPQKELCDWMSIRLIITLTSAKDERWDMWEICQETAFASAFNLTVMICCWSRFWISNQNSTSQVVFVAWGADHATRKLLFSGTLQLWRVMNFSLHGAAQTSVLFDNFIIFVLRHEVLYVGFTNYMKWTSPQQNRVQTRSDVMLKWPRALESRMLTRHTRFWALQTFIFISRSPYIRFESDLNGPIIFFSCLNNIIKLHESNVYWIHCQHFERFITMALNRPLFL